MQREKTADTSPMCLPPALIITSHRISQESTQMETRTFPALTVRHFDATGASMVLINLLVVATDVKRLLEYLYL
jgi:hypothetical protein